MPTPVKRGRPPEEGLAERRREEILRVATDLFAANGFPSTDLQDVADKLGVGKGTIYRYFPTKHALFQAAIDRALSTMRRSIDEAVSATADPLGRIAAAIRAYLTHFDSHPQAVELLMQERAQFPERKKPTYFAQREANKGPWQAIYRDLIAQGQVREMPLDRITDTIGSLVYGTMFTNYFAGRGKPVAEQAEDILDVVFNGLLTPAGQERRRVAMKGRR
jgi:AcrR family transcriptional regulator